MEERMGCAPKRRLGRDRSRLALCGHPRVRKAWMAGTRPAMTIGVIIPLPSASRLHATYKRQSALPSPA